MCVSLRSINLKFFRTMRAEKQILTKEYVARLNAAPFFIVVDYKGLKVAHLTELRKRLQKAGAEIHVVKNSIFQIAAKEAGVGELNGSLTGQIAVVTGQKDISAAAKAVKNFGCRRKQNGSMPVVQKQPHRSILART